MTVPADPRVRDQILKIGVALALASLLGFAMLAIVARWLAPDDNAAFLSVWGLVFGFSSIVSSIEQEIARQAAQARIDRELTPASVGQLAAVALVGGAVALLLVLSLPVGAVVTSGSVLVALLVFVAVSGFSVQYLVRGVLLGSGQGDRYVGVIVTEAVLRVALAATVVWAGLPPSLPVATAILVVGCFGWVPAVKTLTRSVDWRTGRERWRTVLGRIGALALANALTSLVITAFPTLVTAVVGTSEGLAVLFGAVVLSRVPLLLASPVQAMVIPVVVRELAEGRVHRLAVMQVQLAAAATVLAVVSGLAGFVLGPWALRLFMGEQYDAGPLLVALLLIASCYLAAGLLQAAVFVALERYGLLVATWALTAASAVVILSLAPGTTADRGMWSFVGSSLVAYVSSGVALRTVFRRRQAVD